MTGGLTIRVYVVIRLKVDQLEVLDKTQTGLKSGEKDGHV